MILILFYSQIGWFGLVRKFCLETEKINEKDATECPR